jgi:hypothetical protein
MAPSVALLVFWKQQVTLTGSYTLESVEVELSLERGKLSLAEPPVYVEKSTRDAKRNLESKKRDRTLADDDFRRFIEVLVSEL